MCREKGHVPNKWEVEEMVNAPQYNAHIIAVVAGREGLTDEDEKMLFEKRGLMANVIKTLAEWQ